MQRRRPLRLPELDYSRAGGYFVTLCAAERAPIFGRLANESVELTSLGRLVEDRLRSIPVHHPDVRVDDSVVMPDHVHAILMLPGGGQTLGQIVGSLKSSTARLSGVSGLWQRGFYDHVIRDEDDLDRVRTYIRENPYRS